MQPTEAQSGTQTPPPSLLDPPPAPEPTNTTPEEALEDTPPPEVSSEDPRAILPSSTPRVEPEPELVLATSPIPDVPQALDTVPFETSPEPPIEPSEPSPPMDLAAPKPAASAGGSNQDQGLRADDESFATSLEEPIAVRPGKNLARKGLNIRTSTPRFTAATQALARPRNPLVRITFNRLGRVTKAEFVTGQDTGYPEVDKPLLDSLHRWSATGKDLEKIQVDQADAGLTMQFRILFNAR